MKRLILIVFLPIMALAITTEEFDKLVQEKVQELETEISNSVNEMASDVFERISKSIQESANEPANTVASIPTEAEVEGFIDLYDQYWENAQKAIGQFEDEADGHIYDAVEEIENSTLLTEIEDPILEEEMKNILIEAVGSNLDIAKDALIKELQDLRDNLINKKIVQFQEETTKISLREAANKETLLNISGLRKIEYEKKFKKTDYKYYWGKTKEFTKGFAENFTNEAKEKFKTQLSETQEALKKDVTDALNESKENLKTAGIELVSGITGIDIGKSDEPKKDEDETLEEEIEELGLPEEKEKEIIADIEEHVQEETKAFQFELLNNNDNASIELVYLGPSTKNILDKPTELSKQLGIMHSSETRYPGGRFDISVPQFKDKSTIMVYRIKEDPDSYGIVTFKPGKTIFIEASNNNTVIQPQTSGTEITESGLSLKNNVSQSDITISNMKFNTPQEAIEKAKEM